MPSNLIQFPVTPNYIGRALALNPERAQRFQCGGFWLGSRKPSGIVGPEAQQDQIHQAVLDGRLIEIDKGSIKTANAMMDPVKEMDVVGFKTYAILRIIDGVRMMSFLTPSSQAEQDEIEDSITAGRPVDFSKFPELESKKEIAPYMSGIIITDLPSPESTT